MNACLVDNDDDDDVQIIKVVTKKKPVTWVTSSFDGFEAEAPIPQKSSFPPAAVKPIRKGISATQSLISSFTSGTPSQKRSQEHLTLPHRHVNSHKQQSHKTVPSSDLWVDKYKPESKAELAVHKKKVEALEDWFNQSSYQHRKHKAPILLLTGPPGAGKTACVRVLCAELGIDVQEWSSTVEHAADQWSSESFTAIEKSRVDVYTSQSQSSLFQSFLLRANRYHALDLTEQSSQLDKHQSRDGRKTAIVVEEIPNIFFRDTKILHDILRKYHSIGRCPLVFIMSESNSSVCSILKLFPKDLQHKLSITSISLNPVAPTVLTKLLNRIVSREAILNKFNAPSASVIETVAEMSGGDIRSALNTLQFACTKDTVDFKVLSAPIPTKKRKGSSLRMKKETSSRATKRVSPSEDAQSVLGLKDKSVFLFHALGKILYFKRGDPKDCPNHQNLPPHLKEHDRDPLLCIPEEVVDKVHLQGDYFNSFLHENYVDFLSSVEDLERAADYFSEADIMSALWTAKEDLQNYSISVATRGFIYSNSDFCKHDSVRKSSWKPLHKCQWFSTIKQADENIMTALQLFKGYHWEPEVLCTEILPYISLTNPTLHDAGQISFVQEMAQFSQYKPTFRSRQEQLDEMDVVDSSAEDDVNTSLNISNTTTHKTDSELYEEDNVLTSSQTNVQPFSCEDEIIIEDFDDEI